MRIAKVIGSVTLSRTHPSLIGARWMIAVPQMLEDLQGQGGEPNEELVVYDELGAGQGTQIAISEGMEAAMPFYPDMKPIDAYNGAILDQVNIK